ncbi:hypothetical protein DFP73DRAFT_635925 [Morchella snyderi]|nr:hypothetical protein DFP73DRAFT_635925 [Morchella snyderi]
MSLLGYMVAAVRGTSILVGVATACAPLRYHEAEAEKSGNEVEGALGAAKGIRAGVGRWGKDMEELATEAMRSLQERKRAKDQLEELIKKKERLAAEDETLSKEFDEVVAEAIKQGVESSHCLWVKARSLSDRLEQIEEEEQGARVEAETVGKHFDRMEQETEKLVVTLAAWVVDGGQWAGTGARRSVAVAGGVGAGVKVEVDEVVVDDVKVETECAEEVARD